MSGPLAYRWCPTCAEQVTPLPGGACVWCDTPTAARAPRKTGPPRGVYGYLTDDQVRAVHRLYAQGLSLRQCADRILDRTRYSSRMSCANALGEHFARLGLPRRERIEATVAASTVHGLAPRGGVDPAHRRRLKVARGEVLDRPPCAGVRASYPRKGAPCSRPAMAGSDFCIAHDPERRAEIVAGLADARSRRAA